MISSPWISATLAKRNRLTTRPSAKTSYFSAKIEPKLLNIKTSQHRDCTVIRLLLVHPLFHVVLLIRQNYSISRVNLRQPVTTHCGCNESAHVPAHSPAWWSCRRLRLLLLQVTFRAQLVFTAHTTDHPGLLRCRTVQPEPSQQSIHP